MLAGKWTVAPLVALAALVTACGSTTSNHVEPGRAVTTDVRAEGGSARDVLTPVVVRATASPRPVLGTDGKVHLAYELVLTNVVSSSVTINSITARSGSRDLLALTGDDLKGHFKIFGQAAGTTTMTNGQSALVWLDVVRDEHASIPKTLTHTVDISVAQPQPPIVPATVSEPTPTIEVDRESPIVISSPLAGKRWLDGNSCCEVTPHRAAVNPINGSLWVPERFAIDYVQLDDQNRMFVGPVTDLASYHYFGADIHAVADGKIVSMTTDQPEQKPGANPTGLLIDQYGGNNVVQDIGDGHFAFYAHLQPDNPLKLKVGQKLKRSQVLGHLGNTGNTDSPHLHFHIMDSPNPLASNGLPFVIKSFTYRGNVVSDDNLQHAATTGIPFEIDPTGAGPRTKVSPLYRDLMDYPR